MDGHSRLLPGTTAGLYPVAVCIQPAKLGLRTRNSLLGGLAIPCCRLRLVLWHTRALHIHTAKDELRTGVSPIRSLAIPACRLRVALRHTATTVIQHTES
jgi:hypothetical protein